MRIRSKYEYWTLLNLLFVAFEFFPVQSAIVLDSECSTKPQIIGCQFTSTDTISSSNSIDWGEQTPEDVGIFDLIKPNTTSGALALESRLRWRLPIGAFPHPLLGFEIVVTEKHVSNPQQNVFYTKLNKPIHRVNNAIQHAEFYIKTSGLFKFGFLYDVQISFLPKGQGGVALIEKNVPLWLDNVNCKPSELKALRMRKDQTISRSYFASMWSSAFHAIQLYPARSAVNVTFVTAPKELCISSYKIRLRNVDTDQTLMFMKIEAEPGIFAWNLFEPIPAEVSLVVEIVPDNNDDGSCPCSNCNCVTTSSKPFVLERLIMPEVPREPIRLDSTPHSNDPLWIFALILLVVVASALLVLIALVAFYHRKLINTERHIKLSFGPKREMEACPMKDFVRRNVLIIDRSESDREKQLCEKLANILALSGVKVRFNEWEKSQVEENVYKWISQVLRETEKILIVYGKDWNEMSSVSTTGSQILSLIKPTDPRLIHAAWTQTTRSSPFVETVYILPRHAPLLCGLLNVNFKLETWKSLIDAGNVVEASPQIQENENERVALLGEGEKCGMDEVEEVEEIEEVEEVEDPSTEPVIYPSSSISMASLHVPTHLPGLSQAQADSAYGTMNTAELC